MEPNVVVSEERLLSRFLQLVQVDSVSTEEGELARILENELRSIGFSVFNDGTGPTTGNLIAGMRGTTVTVPPIALNAHMDTVEPGRGVRPVVQDRVVRSSGDTILGGDCKAPLAAILEGVRAVVEAGVPRPDLELLFTWGEERAHLGARALDISLMHSACCFTLDSERPIGTIIESAPGYYSVKAAFRGRAAHAGAAPEKGINALLAASRAIARMPLGRIDHETTANVGLIRGGSGRNTVPALVELEGEARSRDAAKLDAQVEAMRRAMEEEAARIGATLDLDIKVEYRPYRLDPDAPVVAMARRALEWMGMVVTMEPTGGGSDANDLNAKGLPTVVLGSGLRDPHTVDESFAVDDLVILSRLVVELISVGAAG